MQPLTSAGENAVQNLAQRYGVSVDAVKSLLSAVSAGGGTMAQFYHPELGGGGQWMRGGMTMVGDMFNHGLQATVSGLCSELSSLLSNQQVFAPAARRTRARASWRPGNNWWPSELGSPSSSGGQNDARYAYFPNARRLAISRNGQVTVYDTLDHNIGGVQQQQGGLQRFAVVQQPVRHFHRRQLADRERGGGTGAAACLQQPVYQQPQQPVYQQPQQPAVSAADLFTGAARRLSTGRSPRPARRSLTTRSSTALERLGSLHQKGVLSDQEFASKKAELLSRL